MKEVTPGKTIEYGQARLTPLEEKQIHCHVAHGRVWFWVSKRPTGLLVSTPEGELSLDISQLVADE